MLRSSARLARASAPQRFPFGSGAGSWSRYLDAGAAALLAALFAALPPQAAANDETRLFEVFINGRTTHIEAEFHEQGRKLFATVDDLASLGLRVDGLRPGPDGRVELGLIPGLAYTIDERRQVLRLSLVDRWLVAHKVANDTGVPAAPLNTPMLGVVLNYQFDATEEDGRTETDTLLNSRFSTPWGVGATSWLVDMGLPIRTLVRLDTNYTAEDPDGLRRWEAGDLISSGLAWTRPYRLGGVQVASDFGVRPGLVTFPTPNLAGHADLPSTVDVLVDNVREVSEPVEQGPFEVSRAPVVTGANSVDLVVRDAAGRQSVQSLDFYVSPTLMAPGLATYSAEGGWLRPNYALADDRYTEAALSGSVRLGILPWLTAEGHAEASREVAMAGAGVAVDIFNRAAGSLAVAASAPDGGHRAANTHGAPGGQISAGIERVGRWLDLSASTTIASRDFRDVPSSANDLPPTFQAQIGAGVSFPRFGSLHVALVDVSGRSAFSDLGSRPEMAPGITRATIGTATYSRRIWGSADLAINAFRDFERDSTTGITFGVSIPLGPRRAASVGVGENASRPSAEIAADQSAFAPGDIGWRGEVSRDVVAVDDGEVSYVSRPATVGAEIDHVGGQTGYRAEATGAVIGTTSGLFVANRISDSYAIVDTSGVPNVAVLQENRLVGHTDDAGLLLLPTLSGWQNNHISIDANDLPADVTGTDTEKMVRLPAASGGRVVFSLHRGTSALAKLVLPSGKPVPLGSTAVLGKEAPVPVGHDGDVFLTTLTAKNVLHVRTVAGPCTVRFLFAAPRGTLPTIGPFTCIADNTP